LEGSRGIPLPWGQRRTKKAGMKRQNAKRKSIVKPKEKRINSEERGENLDLFAQKGHGQNRRENFPRGKKERGESLGRNDFEETSRRVDVDGPRKKKLALFLTIISNSLQKAAAVAKGCHCCGGRRGKVQDNIC